VNETRTLNKMEDIRIRKILAISLNLSQVRNRNSIIKCRIRMDEE
jgi:hypothetical protein